MKSANLGPQFVGFSWVLLLKLGRGTLVSSLQRALLREQAGKRWVTCFLYRCYQIYQNGNGNILFPFLSMRSPGFVLPCIDWTQTGLGDLCMTARSHQLASRSPSWEAYRIALPSVPLSNPLRRLGSKGKSFDLQGNQGKPQDPLGYDA